MLLAKAGILDGRPAVTHHAALDDLRALGIDVRAGARWVDAGDVLSAGGVTSGIDLALHLLERFLGAELAQSVEQGLEHRRLDAAVV
jgi:transcriptional regulator GlxA family with amidase domain